MNKRDTSINGVIMNHRVSESLSNLQDGYGQAVVDSLDKLIGFLLKRQLELTDFSSELLESLFAAYNAKEALLELLPDAQKDAGE